MSDAGLHLMERNGIDAYLSRNFRIVGIREELGGAQIELEHPGGERAQLLLLTADARRYVSARLIAQQKGPGEAAAAD